MMMKMMMMLLLLLLLTLLILLTTISRNEAEAEYVALGGGVTTVSWLLGSTSMLGSAVAISEDGSTIAAGASSLDNFRGSVFMFTLSVEAGAWVQAGSQLFGSDAVGYGGQGYSVALSASGAVVAFGAPDDGTGGAAWVFTLAAGGVWVQDGPKLVGDNMVGFAMQGIAVAVSGDGSVVASGGASDNVMGSVWIFTRNSTGEGWSQSGDKLTGSEAIGSAGFGSGLAFSADGSVLAVGGYQDNSGIGAVWIFTSDGSGSGSGSGAYAQQGGKLVGAGAMGTSVQGLSVALSSDGATLVSGGYGDGDFLGAVWVFTNNNAGGWAQQGPKLVGASPSASVPVSSQGSTVSISADGTTIMWGGVYGGPYDSGASWVYTLTCCGWVSAGPTFPSLADAVPGNTLDGYFAYMSADTTTVVVGIPGYYYQAGGFSVYIGDCVIPASATIDYASSCAAMENGTVCDPSCVAGYTATDSLAVTCLYGHFTTPAGVCLPNCPSTLFPLPPNTENIDCSLGQTAGTTCYLACSTGFSLVSGTLAANCTTAGTWIASTAVCSPISCPRPADNSSAMIYSTACPDPLLPGASCTPHCLPGYTAVGNLTITCSLGIASPADTVSLVPPSCVPNPCSASASPALNAKAVFPVTLGGCVGSVPSGQPCLLGCAPGFLANGNLLASCTAGSFTVPTGTCVVNPPASTNCSQPALPFPVTVGNCPVNAANGTVCTLSCAAGYSAAGDMTATCVNRTFYTNITCLPNACDISNFFSGSTPFQAGSCPDTTLNNNSSCTLQCIEGYYQSGLLDLSCQAGNVAGPLGNCLAMPCPCVANETLMMTQGDCPDILPAEETCAFGCAPGYSLIGPIALTQLCADGDLLATNGGGFCMGLGDVFTASSSAFANPPLVVSPGSILSFSLSPLDYLPADVYLSLYTLDGVFADAAFAVPRISSITSGATNVTLQPFCSFASGQISNQPMSSSALQVLYVPLPVLTGANPSQIIAQITQLVEVQGSGFVDLHSLRCIVNGTLVFRAVSVRENSVTCEIIWPVAEIVSVPITIANDGAVNSSATRSTVTIVVTGGCGKNKFGSVPGVSQCECPAGTGDTGSACAACPNGYYNPTPQIGSNVTTCTACPANMDTNGAVASVSAAACVCVAAHYYDESKHSCQPCVQGMLCPGNNVVLIEPGYWRVNNVSAAVLSCPGGSINCPGSANSSNSDSLCALGYMGPLCSVCASGYAALGPECILCPKSAINTVVLVILILMAFLLGYFLVSSAGGQQNASAATGFDDAETAKNAQAASFSVVIKVTVSYLQVLYYLGRLSANWGSVAARFFAVVGIVGAMSPSNYTVHCSANWGFYDKLIFVYISPAIVFAILSVIYFFRHFVRRLDLRQSLSDFQMALMLLLYQIHPTIMLEVISSFPCQYVLGTGSSFLKADMAVNCSSAKYTFFAVISALYMVFYVFGAMAVVLFRLNVNFNAGNLQNPSHPSYQKYRFFFFGYQSNRYFWEAAIMLRKMGIVAFSVLASPGLQLVFGSVIVNLAQIANLQQKPFASPLVTRLDGLALATLYVTVILGFFFLLNNGDNMWVAVLLILINSATAAILFSFCVRHIHTTVSRMLGQGGTRQKSVVGAEMSTIK